MMSDKDYILAHFKDFVKTFYPFAPMVSKSPDDILDILLTTSAFDIPVIIITFNRKSPRRLSVNYKEFQDWRNLRILVDLLEAGND